MGKLAKIKSVAARALEFAILTGVRRDEAREAVWSEIDLNAKCWTIPAERMKAGQEHRVPLSPEAIKGLKALPRDGGSLVFISSQKDCPLADNSLRKVLRQLHETATIYGFRSTFRDWAAEKGYPDNVCEKAIAHSTGNKVQKAYQRAYLFEPRAVLMNDWSWFCYNGAEESKVLPMRRA